MKRMARLGTLGTSLLIHGIGVGFLVWVGLLMPESEVPVLAVSSPRAPMVVLERPTEAPRPTFEPAAEPEPKLQVEEVPVEIEHEPVDEVAEALKAIPIAHFPDRPAPKIGRPIAFTPMRVVEPAAAPEPVAEAVTETKPIEIHNPPPRYPRLARKRGLEGEVVVEVVVLPDGTCGDAKVVEHAGVSSFADAALAALRQWKFRPAMRGGDPIAFLQRVRFIFKLKS